MSIYSHLPLQDPSKNCRFLVLKPEKLTNTSWAPDISNVNATPPTSDSNATEVDGLLHGLIIEAPLSSAAEKGYFALSYCWGQSTTCSEIVVNDGRRLGITPDLEAAIRHLDAPVIWIDQICIDQTNLQEKSSQIPLMAQIYREATKVLIWLGLPSEDSGIAMDYIQSLAEHYATLKLYLEENGHQIESVTVFHILGKIELDEAILNSETARAVMNLFQRPWFTRTWTLQERLLAKDSDYICGTRSLNAPFMMCCAFFMQEVAKLLTDKLLSMPGMSGPDSLEEDGSRAYFVRKQIMADPIPLQKIILELNFGSHPPQTTDPRDKIYAILNLASDVEDLGIVPDYSTSCEQVFRDVARRVIHKGNFVDYLSYVDGRYIGSDLPSWVYDPRISQLFLQGYLDGWNCPFTACSDKTQPPYEEDIEPHSREENLLRLQGYEVDMIQDLESFSLARDGEVAYIEVLFLVAAVLTFYERAKTKLETLYDSPERAAEAAWRTPIEDCYYESGKWSTRADERAYVGWRQIVIDASRLVDAFPSTSAGVDDNESSIEDDPDQLAKAYHQMNIAADAKLHDRHGPENHEDLERAPSDTSTQVDVPPDDLMTDELLSALHIHTNISMANFQLLLAESDLEKAIRMFPSTTTNEQHEWTYRISRLKSRRPFLTRNGYIGMAPARTQPGDIVVIFFGGKLPYVLRPVPARPGFFELIGNCYCDGIMDGELFRSSVELEEATFTLV